MANPNQGRKLMVRTALVTGATVASLMGAQSLALMDKAALAAAEFTPSPEVAAASPILNETPIAAKTAPNITIQRAAPSVIILRHPGQPAPSTGKTSARPAPKNTVIQPPVPAQISAHDPVIVSQPAPAVTRSSR